MSKFIRTKDTIFEVVEETDIVYRVKAKSNPNNIYAKSKCQTIVLKEAKSIKKLLDGIVMTHKNGGVKMLYTKEQIDKAIRTHENHLEDYIIYGLIWTPKGLIFVSKLEERKWVLK